MSNFLIISLYLIMSFLLRYSNRFLLLPTIFTKDLSVLKSFALYFKCSDSELILDEKIQSITPTIEIRVKAIKLIATVAPLLGLLGTVIGMIAVSNTHLTLPTIYSL